MKRHLGLYHLLSVMLLVLLTTSPFVQFPTAAQGQNGQGQPNVHGDDPCDQLPNPPGEAKGIEKRCPPPGSSSGIAKGDFNGDGFADLAIGVPDEDIGSIVDAGAVNIIYGSANGLTTSTSGIPSSQFWSANSTHVPGGAQAGDRFGAALAAGDFNGDGFTDLAIGIPNKTVDGQSGSGAVVIIYGSSHGLTTSDSTVPAPQYCDLNNADPPFLGLGVIHRGGAHFGQSLAWGNFNGDKVSGKDIGDLAIGVPGAGLNGLVGQNVRPNVGVVWVVLGNTSHGLTLSGSLAILGDEVGSFFGTALTAGDFNGDGLSDLAIGAPVHSVGTVSGAGKVFIVNGSTSAANLTNGGTSFDQVWSQDSTGITCCAAEKGDQFGEVLVAGDFNGDGKADLAIGVPLEDIEPLADAGIVEVLYGSSPGGLSATAGPGNQIWSLGTLGLTNEAGAQFGRALAAGDFNGDGKVDLAVGAPFKDVLGIIDAGQVNVIYGSSSGLSLTGAQTWTQTRLNLVVPGDIPIGSRAGDRFGSSLTAWNFGFNREVDSSGHVIIGNTADLAIGAPFEAVGTVSGAGAVIVLYGSVVANGVSFVGQLWTQASPGVLGDPEKNDHFGAALY